MASVNHPTLYDPASMVEIKAAFYDVWNTITLQSPLRDRAHDHDVSAEIIRQLLDLVAEGKTSRHELKARVIKNLLNWRGAEMDFSV